MKRIDSKTGELFVPHRYANGKFKLGDPAHGRKKHHSANAVEVDSLFEAEALVSKGFSLRMRGTTSNKVNLISAESIQLD